MNQQEIELASKIIAEIHNTTGYGYDVLTRGTMLASSLSLVWVALWCISMAILAWVTWKQWDIKNKDSNGKLDYYILLIVIGIALAFVYSSLSDAILGMISPEYVVLNKIIDKVTQ